MEDKILVAVNEIANTCETEFKESCFGCRFMNNDGTCKLTQSVNSPRDWYNLVRWLKK